MLKAGVGGPGCPGMQRKGPADRTGVALCFEAGGAGAARALLLSRVVVQRGGLYEAGMRWPAAGGLREGDEAGPTGGGDAVYPAPVCAELGDEVATGEQARAMKDVK